MAIKRELIQFTIVNSTDCNYNLPLFQQNVYSVNATTKYSWDVTTANLSCGTGTIVVNSVTYNLTYTPTLAGLLSALNALGFGFFCSETIGGSTYIYVVDDTNVYGNLDLCSVGTTTTTTSTTSTTTTAAPTTTTTSTTTTTTAAPTTTTTSTTTTTTTVGFETFTLAYSAIDGATACSNYPTINTTQYYAVAGSLLQTGTIIYTDTALTTPAPNGFYSNGVNYWNTGAGAGNLQNQTSCSPTTTTTTSTTTAAPTTTSTTTTTTTAQVFVNFYGVMGDTSISQGVLYFSTDQVNWTPVAQPFSNTCAIIDAFLVNIGDTVYISIGDPSSTVYYYNAVTGTSCPSNSQTYCGIGSMFSVVVNSTTDVAITQYVSGGDIVPCATGTSTTTTTTTAAPTTTSTTTTTTTSAPTTTTTSTTTTTTTLFSNLFFDGSVSNCGYYITAINVNSVSPTLTGGADVPFCTDGHNYNTTQTGTNETLNLTIGTFTLNGCITVVDSASNTFQQNVTGNGNLAFTGLTINNTTAVVITLADNAC